MEYLDGVFGEWVITLNSLRGHSWAPHSPDLNPLDYYVWVVLKESEFKPTPSTIDELSDKIKSSCASLALEEMMRAQLDLLRRARHCIELDGSHFKHKL